MRNWVQTVDNQRFLENLVDADTSYAHISLALVGVSYCNHWIFHQFSYISTGKKGKWVLL